MAPVDIYAYTVLEGRSSKLAARWQGSVKVSAGLHSSRGCGGQRWVPCLFQLPGAAKPLVHDRITPASAALVIAPSLFCLISLRLLLAKILVVIFRSAWIIQDNLAISRALKSLPCKVTVTDPGAENMCILRAITEPVTHCVTLCKSLCLSEPQVLHLWLGDDNICLSELAEGLHGAPKPSEFSKLCAENRDDVDG